MPMDRAKYGDGWEIIAWYVKAAAGWRCSSCGIGHMTDKTISSCLTVHHPDRDPDNPGARLVALCAWCHLRAEARLRSILKG